MLQKNATILACLLTAGLSAGCGNEVSFQRDVNPVLQKNCAACHTAGGAGYVASGFSVTSYDSVMKGTKFGPIITPGVSISSTLVLLLEGKAHPSIQMPRDSKPLPPQEIDLIKRWINAGAKNN